MNLHNSILNNSTRNILHMKCSKVYSLTPYQISVTPTLKWVSYHLRRKT